MKQIFTRLSVLLLFLLPVLATTSQAQQNSLTVNFSMMSPHVGDDVWLAVIEAESMVEVGRTYSEGALTFVMEIPEILEEGKSYHVDFFADENENGHYDPPGADHAWRLEIEDALGDETLEFSHQIAFSDVEWKHRLRLALSGMTESTGQKMILYVRDQSTGNYLDTITIESIPGDEFTMDSYVIGNSGNYMLDFYSDLNGNGLYDAPPADHAWRLQNVATLGDLDQEFIHSQDFTDIFQATGVSQEKENSRVSVYPNPAVSYLNISMETEPGDQVIISVYSPTGSVLSRTEEAWNGSVKLDIGHLPDGLYILQLDSDSRRSVSRFIKQ